MIKSVLLINDIPTLHSEKIDVNMGPKDLIEFHIPSMWVDGSISLNYTVLLDFTTNRDFGICRIRAKGLLTRYSTKRNMSTMILLEDVFFVGRITYQRVWEDEHNRKDV